MPWRMKLTLLVLAAGMGSRYGGLKQLDPVGPSGEVVLDYSVHDAVRAGVQRVVFVIRRDFEDTFRAAVLPRYAGVVEVALAFQDLADLPAGIVCPSGREKPWGTAHAIWAAREVIDSPFLVVNADDFYGAEAFAVMADFLKATGETARLVIGMVAYPLRNTLSEHGTVARGICTLTLEQNLASVEEHTGLQRKGLHIEGTDTKGIEKQLNGEEMISMNFWGFTPAVFPHLGRLFGTFLKSGGTQNPKSEFYIPSAVSEMIASGETPAKVLFSNGRWFGVTYREDRQAVADALAKMVEAAIYPSPLFPCGR
jgi:hypothetical protein